MSEDNGAVAVPAPARPSRKRLRVRLQRRFKTLARKPFAMRLASRAVFDILRLVAGAQRPAAGSDDFSRLLTAEHPAIVALWHGQHLLAPFFRPRHLPYVALLSRSADAEINAGVVERFGIRTVRGSGGRVREAASRKGGARALIELKRLLARGVGVCMIADVPKGVAREAGLGIVTLAKLSGRPIIPAAAATSRRHVLEKTWDRTMIPLPFGRMAVAMEPPILVPASSTPDDLERIRREVTAAIERANQRAIRLADARAGTAPA